MAGQWKGPFTIPGQQERLLVLKLDQATDGSWQGAIRSPADTTQFEELSHISIHGSAVSFRYRPPDTPAQVIFSGNYQSWNDAIKGTIIMGNYNVPVVLERLGLHPDAAAAAAADTALTAMDGEAEKIINIRHENNFAIVGGGGYWVPIHILKEDERNINDITTGDWAYNAGIRWYIIDDLALNARATRGGLGFKTNDYNLSLFEGFGLNSDSYLAIDGIEVLLTTYIGDVMFRESKFNPFVTLLAGYYDWELTSNGRNTDPILILERPVKDKDWGFGFGLGTEYPFGKILALEFTWLWQMILTQDSTQWDTDLWTNTHFFSFNLGLVINF